jgi:hypothetical protein
LGVYRINITDKCASLWRVKMNNLENKDVVIVGNRETDWAIDILTHKEYKRPGINLDVVVRVEDAFVVRVDGELRDRNPGIIIIREKHHPYSASTSYENVGSITDFLVKKGYFDKGDKQRYSNKGLVLGCYNNWCDRELEEAYEKNGIPVECILRGVGFFSGDNSTEKNVRQFYSELERVLRTLSEMKNT